MTHGSTLLVTGMLCVNMGQYQLNSNIGPRALFEYEIITLVGLQELVT